jgi:hypothetical protein
VPITAKVVGGDGFHDLTVEAGHTVEMPGYTGEPWLRVDEQGTVEENQASSATYLNQSRFGSAENTDIPDWVTIEGATKNPRWKTVGHGGNYVWHDHRIHYMTPQIDPTLLPGTNRVVISDRDDGLWYVPLSVDGTDYEILGELREFPAPSPFPQWGLATSLLVLLAVAGLGRVGAGGRRHGDESAHGHGDPGEQPTHVHRTGSSGCRIASNPSWRCPFEARPEPPPGPGRPCRSVKRPPASARITGTGARS